MDNCPKICDEWAKKDTRIKVIHKINGGVSSARNEALNIAEGDYIGFVDSDDYIEPDMYESLYKCIISNLADIAVCNNTHVNDSGQIINTTSFKNIIVNKNDLINYFIIGEHFDSSSNCNKLFSKNAIANIRFDEKIKVGEDYLFNYFVLKNSLKLVSIDDVLYNYIFHDSSVMHKVNKDVVSRWKNIKRILTLETDSDYTYKLVLSKYQSELLCCARELLRSDNKLLIDDCYPEICREIKKYSNEFLKLKVSRVNKFSILTIASNPVVFKKLYTIYLKRKQ